MYYTEITKIIEAGMRKDSTKVASYSRLLAKKLSGDGEKRASNRILSVLEKMGNGNAVMDALTAMPVDQESRLDIADIDYAPDVDSLILSESMQDMLNDFMDTIQNKSKMMSLGLEFRNALLLYGESGTGKTMTANVLSRELNLPFFVVRTEKVVTKFMGETGLKLSNIFDFISEVPAVYLFDEFDAIAKARDDDHELGELKRVVNSLLQNIDDFSQDGILIAATNHAQMLDKAVWRRFQTVIELPKPGKDEIRRYITQFPKVADESGINEPQWRTITDSMSDLSYSDIKDVVQNVLKKAVLKEKKEIECADYLVEVFLFKNHGNYNQEEVVKFLYESGVAQKQIARYYSISERQVRNFLGKGVNK